MNRTQARATAQSTRRSLHEERGRRDCARPQFCGAARRAPRTCRSSMSRTRPPLRSATSRTRRRSMPRNTRPTCRVPRCDNCLLLQGASGTPTVPAIYFPAKLVAAAAGAAAGPRKYRHRARARRSPENPRKTRRFPAPDNAEFPPPDRHAPPGRLPACKSSGRNSFSARNVHTCTSSLAACAATYRRRRCQRLGDADGVGIFGDRAKIAQFMLEQLHQRQMRHAAQLPQVARIERLDEHRRAGLARSDGAARFREAPIPAASRARRNAPDAWFPDIRRWGDCAPDAGWQRVTSCMISSKVGTRETAVESGDSAAAIPRAARARAAS